MELRLLPILALLCLVLVGTDSSSPAEEYWHSVLPKTPIPQPIRDLLILDPGNNQNEKLLDVKDLSIKDQKEKLLNVQGFPNFYHYGKKDQNEKFPNARGFPNFYFYGTKDQKEKLPNVQGFPNFYNYGMKDQKLSNTESNPLFLNGKKDQNQKPSDAKKSFTIDDPKAEMMLHTQFYKYNDIHPGEKLTLLFENDGNNVPFLHREHAESIPFSSDKLEDILQLFSIDPNTRDAANVAETMTICESPNVKGENKYCVTSLESLIDQNVARLGYNIRIVSTPMGKHQEYTVLPGMKMIANHGITSCHRQKYPYAVYYCHENEGAEIYRIPLLGEDGTKISAITICHKDTSGWTQGHIVFQVLKIQKPGPPICHFVAHDTLVWLQTTELGHVPV